MAKTLVIEGGEWSRAANERDKTSARVPFLRGILTRSLQESGLGFEEAYKLASAVRQELNDVDEITTQDLRALVLDRLQETGYEEAVLERYQTPAPPPPMIMVDDGQGHKTPFSRTQQRRTLESCGLSVEEATVVTSRLTDYLTRKGRMEIKAEYLDHLLYRYIRRRLGNEAAHRFLVWTDYQKSDRPLLLMIGGIPGCGKSTIATELANRLGIVRIQSTDLLREVMRMMVPKRLLPVLYESSFNAWRALPYLADVGDDLDTLVADGYRSQSELLSVPCEAVVQRALKERVSLILEGVHVFPGMLDKVFQDSDVIVVPIMLAVLNPDRLRGRFKRRRWEAPERGAERYLKNFDVIWRLQSFLLSEADRQQVSIIPNDYKEIALQQTMNTIINTLSKDFSRTPREVFRQRPM